MNGEANRPSLSQHAPHASHCKQQIASVSQQGEDSPEVRTNTYRHDSVGFTVQTRDEESRVSRQATITESLSLIEKMIPKSTQADGNRHIKRTGA